MEDIERAQTRLDNIRTVEPILGALRTISLGSWRTALGRGDDVRRYAERLMAMLPPLLSHIRPSPLRRRLLAGWRSRRKTPPSPARIAVLVIGSERGLCGGFNTTVVGRAERYLAELSVSGAQVELMALGTRVARLFRRYRRSLAWSGALSVTALPTYRLALDLTRQWLARYEEYDLDVVDLIYNAYRGTARYAPAVMRLIPPQLPSAGQVTGRERRAAHRRADAGGTGGPQTGNHPRDAGFGGRRRLDRHPPRIAARPVGRAPGPTQAAGRDAVSPLRSGLPLLNQLRFQLLEDARLSLNHLLLELGAAHFPALHHQPRRAPVV